MLMPASEMVLAILCPRAGLLSPSTSSAGMEDAASPASWAFAAVAHYHLQVDAYAREWFQCSRKSAGLIFQFFAPKGDFLYSDGHRNSLPNEFGEQLCYAAGIVRGNNSLFTIPWHFANSRSFASLRKTTNYAFSASSEAVPPIYELASKQ
jgi:hypothetical protein